MEKVDWTIRGLKVVPTCSVFSVTLVTQIKEVFQIAVMGVKFFHVMVPLEDMVEFMDANTVQIRVLVCQV